MRLLITLEIEDGDSITAQTQFREVDLHKSASQIADKFCIQMVKALLAEFEEPVPDSHADRMRQLERGVRRGIEHYRRRHPQALDA